MAKKRQKPDLLDGARVYLSGPMDFVASRSDEQKLGWRNRVGEFLRSLGAIVFDPWLKPDVRGLQDYGRETADSNKARENWTFEASKGGAKRRAQITGKYWETLHIDLRMVDTADFVVAYCPTNVYSVGTPHEIALCRSQRKPVLFVSPPIVFPALGKLRKQLSADPLAKRLLEEFVSEAGIKENDRGIPSLWYMPLVGGENFFDGFGFAPYRPGFKWNHDIPIDDHESKYKIHRPLMPFLEKLNRELPKKWDNKLNRFVPNDDWLLWDLKKAGLGGTVTWRRGTSR
jgi:hypothetical protein